MKNFGRRLLLIVVAGLPAWGWAAAKESSNPMAGHWDSIFFIALGVLIVWREIRVAKRGETRRSNGWQALNSWRQPASHRPRLIPMLAKLAFKRSSR